MIPCPVASVQLFESEAPQCVILVSFLLMQTGKYKQVTNCCLPSFLVFLQGSGVHPVLSFLSPLNLIDLMSFAPTLVGAFIPLSTLGALGGIDLRWFRIFR